MVESFGRWDVSQPNPQCIHVTDPAMSPSRKSRSKERTECKTIDGRRKSMESDRCNKKWL